MMTVCFLPFEQTNMKHKMEKVKFRYIQPITIICNVNIEYLYEIIEKNLEYNDGLNVYGFNKKTQEFWGKKIIKSVNKLHFNLSIHKKDYSQSYITITPIVGTNLEIEKLLANITSFIRLFEK
jgi:hypothetical protein